MQLNTVYALTHIIPTTTRRKVVLSPLNGAGTEVKQLADTHPS